MRITRISLTNFRSFREAQTIELAPVTLLFGPNSVGKSSVLMSLFYLQQILEKGHCDPSYIAALGEKHVGGFERLVNGYDINKDIVIKLSCDKRGSIGSTYSNIVDSLGEDQTLGLTVDSPTADADTFDVEFHISWSKPNNTAYVSTVKYWLDGEFIAELHADEGLKQRNVSSLSYDNPALLCSEDDDYESESYEDGIVSRLQDLIVNSVGSAKPFNDVYMWHAWFGYEGFSGALPRLGQQIKTTLQIEDWTLNARVHEVFSDIVVAPLDNILMILKESLSIGPLRVIPDALRQINPYPEQSDWYSGEAAWDSVGRSSSQLLAINHWLNGEGGLGLGYTLRRKIIKTETSYLASENALDQLRIIHAQFGDSAKVKLATGDLEEDPDAEITMESPVGDLLKMLESDPRLQKGELNSLNLGELKADIERKVVLWDEQNQIEVTSSDIGVGVSQVIPLVVALTEKSQGVICCEQPELHVHPRIQVALGDLVTQQRTGHTLILETHSEHLILRILRRIRETAEDELPDGIKPVIPNDVSIVYLSADEDGVVAKRIGIDKEGEFTERWPSGFFAERGEELF